MGDGQLLADCLARLEWSPERLAREINRVRGTGTISAKAPYGWLQGSVPRGTMPQVIAQILSRRLNEPITAEALWPTRLGAQILSRAAVDLTKVSWTQQGTWEATEAFELATPTQRWPGTLTPLGGPALIRSAVDWLTEPHEPLSGHSHGEHVSPQAVEVLTHRVVQLRRLDDAQGGPLVLDWVIQDLRWVAYLVRRGAYDATIGAQLHSILAELAQLAGWLAGDLGRHAVGQRYLLLGLHAAHTAGDRALGANIVSCLSYQAAWNEEPQDALRLIKLARKGAGRPVRGAVHALLATRQARAHAQLGEPDACARALDEAAVLGETADPGADPAWSYWVTTAVLAADAGRAWLELGRPDRAEANLLRGLELFGDTQPRNRLLHTMSLAEARLAAGELDGAAEAAGSALDLSNYLDSDRARRRLTDLRGDFSQRESVVARDVCDRIDTALHAA